MSLINSLNWKFVIICVQNQWGVVHPWHGTVANLWGRHKDFTEFNENFEKSYLLNGLSNIVKFFTVWFLKIICIKWIHIFFWVQCSFKIRIRVKVGVMFNISVYHWSNNCRRSKCWTFVSDARYNLSCSTSLHHTYSFCVSSSSSLLLRPFHLLLRSLQNPIPHRYRLPQLEEKSKTTKTHV